MTTSNKPVKIRVTTANEELQFSIHPSTTGKQLFDHVIRAIGLRETWYFGLDYVNSQGYITWLKLYAKVIRQDIKNEERKWLQFRLQAKFYPEDVANELIQDITKTLFYHQVKNAILSDKMYCPADKSVLLASYAMQAMHGDFNKALVADNKISNEMMLPQRLEYQHKMNREEWEDRLTTWWREHKEMTKSDAMMEYLKLARDLEMYGMTYFEIMNKEGTRLWLGIDALGLNIYKTDDKLTPKLGFQWPEIRNISFKNSKFVVKPVDEEVPNFIFYAQSMSANKKIFALYKGNQELYIWRRKPDTIEVQNMKELAYKEKMAYQKERARLQLEITAREQAERKQHEYANQLFALRMGMTGRERYLFGAKEASSFFEQKLKNVQETKGNIARPQIELKTMREGLQLVSKTVNTAERESVKNENRLKQTEVQRLEDELQSTDEGKGRFQGKANKIPEKNVKVGRGKGNTFQDIRKGILNRRVDLFENL